VISQVRPSFWRAYERLAPSIKARARLAYQLFAENPEHAGDTIQWIWIGTHNEFDKLFS
jgi:hypothetical protein